MSALDELREALDGDPNEAIRRQDIFDVLDTFEAEHPGLVDLTAICPRCGYIGCWSLDCAKPENGWKMESGWNWRRSGWEEHVLCPTCAKEAR